MAFVRITTKCTFLIAVLVSLILILSQKASLAGGFLTGAVWSVVNFLLTVRIFEVALLHKDKTKLFLMLMIKFPALYLAGFLLLISKFFPILSLLGGASIIFPVMGGVKLCQKVQSHNLNCQTS